MPRNRVITDIVEINDYGFRVVYERCPAEPDVGFFNDYLDIHSIDPLDEGVVVTEEVEDAIVDYILDEDGY